MDDIRQSVNHWHKVGMYLFDDVVESLPETMSAAAIAFFVDRLATSYDLSLKDVATAITYLALAEDDAFVNNMKVIN